MLIKIINPNTSTSELSGTVQTGNIIADVDVPIAISGYSDSNSLSSFDLAIQDPAGGALTTLQIQFDGDMGASMPQDVIDTLNSVLEAGKADPHHYPQFKDVNIASGAVAGLYTITGLRIS
jgi:hypothetical protein